VAMAGRDREVGAVERGRAHLDQDLVRLGHRLGDVMDLDAIISHYGCFHLPSVMQALPACLGTFRTLRSFRYRFGPGRFSRKVSAGSFRHFPTVSAIFRPAARRKPGYRNDRRCA
jgi:hypothetical protein